MQNGIDMMSIAQVKLIDETVREAVELIVDKTIPGNEEEMKIKTPDVFLSSIMSVVTTSVFFYLELRERKDKIEQVERKKVESFCLNFSRQLISIFVKRCDEIYGNRKEKTIIEPDVIALCSYFYKCSENEKYNNNDLLNLILSFNTSIISSLLLGKSDNGGELSYTARIALLKDLLKKTEDSVTEVIEKDR